MSALLGAPAAFAYSFSITAKPSAKQKAERLEEELRKAPQVDCPVREYFCPGIYAREMSIPAGTVLVGAVHKVENLAILSKGRLILATDSGPLEISAPHTLTVKPGAKNAATALEDSVWTNFLPNPTNETDQEKLVEMFTESKACELLGGSENRQLLENKSMELEV
jgi:hypothetical protein